MRGAVCERQLDARDAQCEGPRFTLSGEHPRGQARKAGLVTETGRQIGPFELERAAAARAFELFAVPPRAARDGFPCDAVQRIATLVVAQARKLRVGRVRALERIGALAAG